MKTKTAGESRLYVVVAAKITTEYGQVIQPAGRQVAQCCHVVSKFRSETGLGPEPITTIILQARDSKELAHVLELLKKKKFIAKVFMDSNPEYGPGYYMTAICTRIRKDQTSGS